jgi:hypothetical protein
MPLRRCLAEHTHREMLLSNLHERYEFNEPTRADYYAMQIAQYAKLSASKQGTRVKLSDMKIETDFRGAPTAEELTEWSKQRWAGRMRKRDA